MKKAVICLALLCSALVIGDAGAVYAAPMQDDPPPGLYGSCSDGSYVYIQDLRLTDGGWTPVWNGIYEEGIGWETYQLASPAGWYGYDLLITNTLVPYWDASVELDYVEFWGYATWGDYPPWALGFQYNLGSWSDKQYPFDSTGFWTWDLEIDPPSPRSNGLGLRYMTAAPEEGGYIYRVEIHGTYEGDESACPAYNLPAAPIWMDSIKPINYTDILEYSLYDGETLDAFDHIFAEQGTLVRSSISGLVTKAGQQSDGYMFVIEGDGIVVEYHGLSQSYVVWHDTVSAGCVLGKLAATSLKPEGMYTQDIGALRFAAWEVDGDDWTRLDWTIWDDSESVVPCSSTLTTENCVNINPNFEQFALGWDTIPPAEYGSGPSILDNGVVLHYLESVGQWLVLDDEEDWYISLVATVSNNSNGGLWDVLGLLLGGDTEVVYLEPGFLGQGVIVRDIGPFELGEPAYPPDVYALGAEPGWNGTNGIEIQFLCVHNGTPVMRDTPYCYFDNASFDEGSEGWDESASGVTWHPIGVNNPNLGAVVLQPGAWISQPIDLPSYDGEDADYFLAISARTALAEEGTIGDIWGSLTATVNHTVEEEIADLGSHDISNVLISLGYNIDFTVTDGNTLTGDLVIENDSESEAEVEFQEICIRPVRGLWPWEEGADQLPEYSYTCSGCTMPTEILAVGAWINWLFCQIGVIWFCHLKPMVLDILQWFKNLADAIGYLGRWLGILLFRLGEFLLDLLVAFGLALKDAFLSILAAAWNFIAGLDILQALYDLAGYAISVLTGGIGLLVDIGNLIITALNILLTMGRVLEIFFAHVLAAMNGASETFSFPSCVAPSEPIFVGWCVGLELAAGVIDEFPALSLSFVLVAGCVGLFTGVWTVRQIGGAMGDV
jgi:hypothetical protein